MRSALIMMSKRTATAETVVSNSTEPLGTTTKALVTYILRRQRKEKQSAEEALKKENAQRKQDNNILQGNARAALHILQESDVNKRYNTRKKQYVPSKHDYKHGERRRGGIDGYHHCKGALKKLTPWINSLKEKGIPCLLLQDGAPAHKSRISRDYLTVERIERMWWPGHSPEVNASEHAWPWMRRHVTRDFTPSCTREECKS
ncbi:hypothetical protein EK21DRAFT_89198 [Setomelanomma holmii]|uniref:Tc1-like transposase DDE domain-containing protein n=1 Tax=Setomelanomma holmii TaxID=210430 RepID=A0A9P4LNQ2_9PLEO|nr:hypothetical protein EK21DRAFT_89198 [Setomelanomma holmii]